MADLGWTVMLLSSSLLGGLDCVNGNINREMYNWRIFMMWKLRISYHNSKSLRIETFEDTYKVSHRVISSADWYTANEPPNCRFRLCEGISVDSLISCTAFWRGRCAFRVFSHSAHLVSYCKSLFGRFIFNQKDRCLQSHETMRLACYHKLNSIS